VRYTAPFTYDAAVCKQRGLPPCEALSFVIEPCRPWYAVRGRGVIFAAELGIRIVQASYLCRKPIMTQCRNHGCHGSIVAANTCSCLEFPALNAWSEHRIANLHHCPAARHGVVGYRWTAAPESPALFCSRHPPSASASRACSLCKPSDETKAARPPDTTPLRAPAIQHDLGIQG